MKKIYYLLGIGTAITTSFVVGPIIGLTLGAAVLAGPYVINRSQHVILQTGADRLLEEGRANDGSGEHLHILSFNIFMRPSLWFVRNVENDWKNERLDIFIREHLPHYSIICLQEMFATFTWRQHTLLHAAEQCGFQHAAIGGAAPFVISDHHLSLKIPFLDAGVVILSKFPILETDALHYSASVLIDAWAPKICLHALIRIPISGRYVHVFNTHMQSTHTGWGVHQTIQARAKQMEELSIFVRKKVSAQPHPVLICGDFNLDARSSPLEYQRLFDMLNRELRLEGWALTNVCDGEHPITYALQGERVLTLEKDWDKQMCLDYVFLWAPIDNRSRGEVVFFEGDGERFFTLSDHQGIEAIIEL